MPSGLEEDFGYIEIKIPNIDSLTINSSDMGKLIAELPIPQLYIETSGSSFYDFVAVDSAEINISGSSGIEIKSLSTSLSGNISGSGSIQIHGGSPDFINMVVSGSGNLNAYITSTNACLVMSGSGSISVNHVVEECVEQMTGSGSLNVMKRG